MAARCRRVTRMCARPSAGLPLPPRASAWPPPSCIRKIHLGGSVGPTGLLADVGGPATHAWSFGPLISWTLPSSGAHARVRATEASADAALAQFDHTVLQALREVQTTFSRYAQDLDRLHLLEQAQQQAELASSQNRRLYQSGRTPCLSSLDAERTLATADMTLANAQAQVSQDQIQLFLTLDGGWDAAAGRSDTTAAR